MNTSSCEPRMYRDLKIALSTLYSLGGPNVISQTQAHEYLLHVQSRNVRRKIQSIDQSRRDHYSKQSAIVANEEMQQQERNNNDQITSSVELGSSWLACLGVLFSMNACDTERLFCAQTLLHRLRRAKISDAIDWEIETHDTITQLTVNPRQLAETYKHWIINSTNHNNNNIHIAAVVARYVYPPSSATMTLGNDDEEERVKGELSLLTIASLLYWQLLHVSIQQSDAQPCPLATALGGVMAMTALRLRYTATTFAAQQHNECHGHPPYIVQRVAQSLQTVWNHAQQHQHTEPSRLAFAAAMHACLGSIPDTLMGSPGGARGRLSMDPRCMQAARLELGTMGVAQLLEILQDQYAQNNNNNANNSEQYDLWTLSTCLQWAKLLPLPVDFVQPTCQLVNKYFLTESHLQQVGLAYVVAILEGGSWSLDDVLVTNLGLSEQLLMQQSTKKKQSSRSKRRQQAVVESSTTEELMERSRREVFQRGEVACLATQIIWDGLMSAAHGHVVDAAADPSRQVAGEGPIGCLAASAHSCLPHLIRHSSLMHAYELFVSILKPYQELCASPNKSVRGLVHEPLYALHEAVVGIVQQEGCVSARYEPLVVDHFFKCSISLATVCSYPTDYFDNMAANSDEELEVERNDIRDLIRVLAGSAVEGQPMPDKPLTICLHVLSHILTQCRETLSHASAHRQLCPETVVHAFSAVVKPLNQLVRWMCTDNSDTLKDLSMSALQALLAIEENIISMFDEGLPVRLLLPVVRTANIAACSISPFLSVFCQVAMANDPRHGVALQSVKAAVQVAARSMQIIPELAEQATQGDKRYDIRGTMRGPGGDDHVGCLVLMRMVFESDELARAVVASSSQFILHLCEMYHELKKIEVQRGRDVWHGSGVTPKSRRILLKVICRLELLSGGAAGASVVLADLFNSAVETIAGFRDREFFDDKATHIICEAVFDLGSFAPSIARTVFDHSPGETCSSKAACLDVLVAATVQCCRHPLLINAHSNDLLRQWLRLRAALFYLLKASGGPDIPLRAVEMMHELIKAECESICELCAAGPSSQSSIFCDEVVSSDTVPAGVFVRVVGEILNNFRGDESNLQSLQNCIETLFRTKDIVFKTVMLSCSDPHTGCFADPRPTLWESFLCAVTDLIKLLLGPLQFSSQRAKEVILDTFVTYIMLSFFPSLSKNQAVRSSDPGMSFDGPHSLSLSEFIVGFFSLGPNILEAVSLLLVSKIPVEFGICESLATNPSTRGAAIIGAALFRGVQGALPPWIVESLPEIYSTFHSALGGDPNTFGLVFRLSMAARFPASAVSLNGGLRQGKLLSGPFFESMSATTVENFINEVTACSSKGGLSSWRRVKVSVKQICGGKKKESDFRQKPALTRWDFDRI